MTIDNIAHRNAMCFMVLAVATTGIAVLMVGSTNATEYRYLDVNVNLTKVETGLFCNNCRTYPVDDDGNTISSGNEFTGVHSILRLWVTIDSLEGMRMLDLDDVEFILQFYDRDGNTYRIDTFGSWRDVDSLPGDGPGVGQWNVACDHPAGIVRQDGSVSTKLCFPIKNTCMSTR